MKKNEIIPYVGILLIFISIYLVICEHFFIYTFEAEDNVFFFGLDVKNFMIDLSLFLAIGLMLIVLILWVYNFFEVKKIEKS